MSETDRYQLTLTDSPSEAAQATIENGLHDFNLLKAGYVNSRTLAVLVRDVDSSETVGGLLGRTTLGLFFIDLVFLPEATRGQGIGSEILSMAEEEAKRRGCTAATLFTIWFQAPDFYARHGYREVGRIECALPGHTRICMSKGL
ncbi:MAG TPA: GNAT family N-acetyltransferase [Acetobacteraceae bacterium]|nr:GNAT family N-acetyltransferase [Acetobacteraceae bacterium]